VLVGIARGLLALVEVALPGRRTGWKGLQSRLFLKLGRFMYITVVWVLPQVVL